MSSVIAAFLMAIAAGLSTTIGAALVFSKKLFHTKNFGLAISLGYILVEIFGFLYLTFLIFFYITYWQEFLREL
jgi:large-conductance mechanosensitive channel